MTKILSYTGYYFLYFLSFFPFFILYIFSDILYFLVYYVVRYRRSVVRTNLNNSFPNKSQKEILSIEKEFYSHFCDIFFETIKLWTISKEDLKTRCTYTDTEFFDRYKEKGQNVIVILGHYGNWEWLPCIGLDKDIEFLSIYKPLRNKVFDKMFKELRSKTSTKLIAKNDTLRTLVKYRRDNIFNVSGFIGDQTPNKKNIHYWTKFLNQDTPILQGAERIAKKLDSAVVFLKMTKKKRGHYQVDLIPISNNPKETADFEITEKHSRELEKLINESPAYWLWSHKRWKHKKND